MVRLVPMRLRVHREDLGSSCCRGGRASRPGRDPPVADHWPPGRARPGGGLGTGRENASALGRPATTDPLTPRVDIGFRGAVTPRKLLELAEQAIRAGPVDRADQFDPSAVYQGDTGCPGGVSESHAGSAGRGCLSLAVTCSETAVPALAAATTTPGTSRRRPYWRRAACRVRMSHRTR